MKLSDDAGNITLFGVVMTFLMTGVFLISISHTLEVSRAHYTRTQMALCAKKLYLDLNSYINKIRKTNKLIYWANVFSKSPLPKISIPAQRLKKSIIFFQDLYHKYSLFSLYRIPFCKVTKSPIFKKGLPFGLINLKRKKDGQAKRIVSHWDFLIFSSQYSFLKGIFKWNKKKRNFDFEVIDQVIKVSLNWRLPYGLL